MEDAVIHPGLRHRHRAAAIVPPVTHGHQSEFPLHRPAVQPDRPPVAQIAEEEIDRHRRKIAPPASEGGGVGDPVDAVRHLGVNPVAGDGEAVPAVALDQVQGELRSVPEVLRIGELLRVRAEILQKVIPRAGWNRGHRRVVKARNSARHLMDGAVAAAGVDPHRAAALGQAPGHLPGPAGAVGQQALALQAVPPAQRVRHGVHPGGLVPLARVGVDDPYMAHGAPSLMFVRAVSARTKTRRT